MICNKYPEETTCYFKWIFLHSLRKHLISLKYDSQPQDNEKTTGTRPLPYSVQKSHCLGIKRDTVKAQKISLMYK